jgi:hypothetical protein
MEHIPHSPNVNPLAGQESRFYGTIKFINVLTRASWIPPTNYVMKLFSHNSIVHRVWTALANLLKALQDYKTWDYSLGPLHPLVEPREGQKM